MGATASRTRVCESQRQQAGLVRVVLYVRISDDPEGSEKGVDRQEADCRAYATAHGMSVVEVFRENDTSAFKQRTIVLPSGEKVRRVIRPRFRAMLQLLARREADVMVAYDLDRAVRDPRDLEDLIDAKVLYGFRVLSTTGSLRLDNDADIAMARVLVAMANKSSADTARRVKRAARQQALEGRRHGGRAPYGYRLGDSTLTIIPEQARLIREAGDRVLAGESLYHITRAWNDRGERTAGGGLWTDSVLARILRNPTTRGMCSYRPERPDGTRDVIPEFVVQGVWTPILDPDRWEQVVQVIDARRARRKIIRTGIKRVRPFSGLIRCAKCGAAMIKQGPHYVCANYKRGVCARRINATEVTQIVEDAVLSVFNQITLTPNQQPARDRDDREQQHELSALMDADRKALEQLDDDHYDGTIDRATWTRQRTRLLERITTRQREYQEQLAHTPLVDVDLDLGTVATEWHGRSVQWQHDAAALVLEAVLIDAHPKGVAVSVTRRRDENEDEYQARRREYRARLLAQRVEFVWRA